MLGIVEEIDYLQDGKTLCNQRGLLRHMIVALHDLGVVILFIFFFGDPQFPCLVLCHRHGMRPSPFTPIMGHVRPVTPLVVVRSPPLESVHEPMAGVQLLLVLFDLFLRQFVDTVRRQRMEVAGLATRGATRARELRRDVACESTQRRCQISWLGTK